jgi:UDP-N-acetylglucosamine 2-epimerase (non-hydrolysing)
MKLLVVVGTRPEAIKLAPIVRLAKTKKDIEVLVCNTGQHKEMLEQAFKALDLNSDYDLDVMCENNTLSDVTGKVLKQVDKIIHKTKPDWLIVQGDTATAFAGGLAGFYNHVKVAHVEAGLRSGDNHNPFPEEVNRKLIAAFADVHFAPTQTSRTNLLKENIKDSHIAVVGNTVIDALKLVKQKIDTDKKTLKSIKEKLKFLDEDKKLILVTSHRRENHGEGLENICKALKEISEKRKDVQIIFPVHLNPNVKKTVHGILGESKNIVLTEPLNYLSTVYLMDKSYLILTDSGGIQEEASAFSTPVLVLRKTTERMEGIKAGIAKLVGTDKNKIVKETLLLLKNEEEYLKMKRDVSPYGDGLSSQRILDELRVRV